MVDGRLLLDLGEATYLKYRPRYGFLIHLPSDHAVFMTTNVRLNTKIHVPEPMSRLPDARVLSRPIRVNSYRDRSGSNGSQQPRDR
jgi:hypothetical protein